MTWGCKGLSHWKYCSVHETGSWQEIHNKLKSVSVYSLSFLYSNCVIMSIVFSMFKFKENSFVSYISVHTLKSQKKLILIKSVSKLFHFVYKFTTVYQLKYVYQFSFVTLQFVQGLSHAITYLHTNEIANQVVSTMPL